MHCRWILLVFCLIKLSFQQKSLEIKGDAVLDEASIEYYWSEWKVHKKNLHKNADAQNPELTNYAKFIFSLQKNYLKPDSNKKKASFTRKMKNKDKENFICNLHMIRRHNFKYEQNVSTFKVGLNAYCNLSFKDVLQNRAGLSMNM